MKLFKRWRIVVMSDAQQNIKQFSLHKLVGFGLVAIFFVSLASVAVTIGIIQTLSHDQQELTASLENAQEEIDVKDQKLAQFEEDRLAIEGRLTELRSLEEQLKEMMSSLNPDRLAHFDEGPQGGQSLLNDDIKLVSYEEEQGLEDYSSLREHVPELVDRYKMAVDDLSHMKDELKQVPIAWPADTERITSEFGHRDDPFARTKAFHGGLDLAGPWGTEIYSTAEGTVELAGRDGSYGLSVVVNHGNGYKTQYAHLSQVMVEKGDQVEQGDLIGGMGSTGRSTGVHLHYEIYHNGERIDPYPYMTFVQRVLNE
ncbi:M23 family metallopeptidase [Aquisalibacillus elongatus]|uniref:Murein DD-endopeptidase MepM/ murein hydrolase activator NlpD n=1 Tax=Aquisalibacillus elongatus TaxID=485577 RepID=A0A3N5BN53_9BACI|nr:M23 family metallopeptidase [Aquisalibacillus elongatus]RPF51148.1 murein DD-endopeptidase MepM/ murein hydrolase activator NlpD [Aquisalibacillus elongatus]